MPRKGYDHYKPRVRAACRSHRRPGFLFWKSSATVYIFFQLFFPKDDGDFFYNLILVFSGPSCPLLNWHQREEMEPPTRGRPLGGTRTLPALPAGRGGYHEEFGAWKRYLSALHVFHWSEHSHWPKINAPKPGKNNLCAQAEEMGLASRALISATLCYIQTVECSVAVVIFLKNIRCYGKSLIL